MATNNERKFHTQTLVTSRHFRFRVVNRLLTSRTMGLLYNNIIIVKDRELNRRPSVAETLVQPQQVLSESFYPRLVLQVG